jgi:hypothetical protein
MEAWGALEAARQIEVLVTSMGFQPGRSNGVALASMARSNRPGIRVLFMALPEYSKYAEGLGTFMPMPVSVPDVLKVVERFLTLQSDNPRHGL